MHNFLFMLLVLLIMTPSLKSLPVEYFTHQMCSTSSNGQKDFHVKLHCFKFKIAQFSTPTSKCSQCVHSSALHIFNCAAYCVSLYVKHEPAGFDLQSQPGFQTSPELRSGGTDPRNMALYPLCPRPLPASVGEKPLLCNGAW